MNLAIIFLGKLFSWLSLILNFGNGSTWPGHIALQTNPHFVSDVLKDTNMQIILIAGTNGKTTTSLLLKTILETNGKKVIHNTSGANLFNGLASTLLLASPFFGKIKADYAIFEVDENALIPVLKDMDPGYIILLNLFRDQLDRYGEVATIARKWAEALHKEEHIKLILNADDPEIAYIGQQLFNQKLVTYFGLTQAQNDRSAMEHAADSMYCPHCAHKLTYEAITYSHLGNWSCPHCHLKRPQLTVDSFSSYPLAGVYNQYNVLAAVTMANQLGFHEQQIVTAFKQFKPAFGRQEILQYKGKNVQFFLSKNPTGFNQSLHTIRDLQAKYILIALNDRIADGRDISWIWDIDTEILNEFAQNIIVTGDRSYDMGLRMKYSQKLLEIKNLKLEIEINTEKALNAAIDQTPTSETLYILPTYTAMLDIRKIIGGKKIL